MPETAAAADRTVGKAVTLVCEKASRGRACLASLSSDCKYRLDSSCRIHVDASYATICSGEGKGAADEQRVVVIRYYVIQ